MLEYFQMRLAPMFILGVFGSLVLSWYLAEKLNEKRFKSKTSYNLAIYSPFIISTIVLVSVGISMVW